MRYHVVRNKVNDLHTIWDNELVQMHITEDGRVYHLKANAETLCEKLNKEQFEREFQSKVKDYVKT